MELESDTNFINKNQINNNSYPKEEREKNDRKIKLSEGGSNFNCLLSKYF
jgi:hypothetical protein